MPTMDEIRNSVRLMIKLKSFTCNLADTDVVEVYYRKLI